MSDERDQQVSPDPSPNPSGPVRLPPEPPEYDRLRKESDRPKNKGGRPLQES